MAQSRELGAGAWSYFGDPQAISHDGHTFTGWISTAGHVWVARLTGGKLSKHLLFRGLGRDDHNNPSLVFLRDGRLIVFFSPHSGHDLPPPGIPSKMYYRISQHARSIDGGDRCTPSTPMHPGRWATPTRTRSCCATGCGCSGAAAAGTRPSRTPTTA
jgi:hypothetical protein